MKSKHLITPLIILFIFSACSTNIHVVPIKNVSEQNENELIQYFLPKTVLEIKIPIVKKQRKQGLIEKIKSNEELYNSVIRELYINYGISYKLDTSVSYSIEGKITLNPISVPDENKLYSIRNRKISGAWKNSATLSLSNDGILQSGEFAQKNQSIDVGIKTVETVVGIVGSFFSGNLLKNDQAVPNFNFSTNDTIKNREIFIQKMSYDRIIIVKNELELLFNERNNLTIKVYPNVTKDIYESKRKQIDKRIEILSSELFGKVSKKITWVNFIFDPVKENVMKGINKNQTSTKIDLLYINKKTGFTVAEQDTTTHKGSDVISLNLTLDKSTFGFFSQKENEINEKSKEKSKNKSFLYYNVPAKSTVTLLKNGKPINTVKKTDQKKGDMDVTMYFPQLGIVKYLPAKFNEAKVVLYEDIGSIKTVSYKSELLVTGDEISAGGTAIDSIYQVYKSIMESKEDIVEVEEIVEEQEEQVIHIYWHNEDDRP